MPKTKQLIIHSCQDCAVLQVFEAGTLFISDCDNCGGTFKAIGDQLPFDENTKKNNRVGNSCLMLDNNNK